MTPDLEKGVSEMCNLSEGLVEQVTEQVTEQVMESSRWQMLQNLMSSYHITLEEAMRALKIPEDMKATFRAKAEAEG